jgi:hypothetical protein
VRSLMRSRSIIGASAVRVKTANGSILRRAAEEVALPCLRPHSVSRRECLGVLGRAGLRLSARLPYQPTTVPLNSGIPEEWDRRIPGSSLSTRHSRWGADAGDRAGVVASGAATSGSFLSPAPPARLKTDPRGRTRLPHPKCRAATASGSGRGGCGATRTGGRCPQAGAGAAIRSRCGHVDRQAVAWTLWVDGSPGPGGAALPAYRGYQQAAAVT